MPTSNMNAIMQKAPLIAISRHRLAVDGEGVTTLVAFHGCTLHCRYCLNRQCLQPDGLWREMSTGELLEAVRIDNLYYLATGGGITFGGGEPCLRSQFIEEFCQMADSQWKINIETCLNVGHEHVERLLPVVDKWIVDIKDTDNEVYKSYTGKSNQQALDNLRWLMSHDGMAEKVRVRLPLIPEYNTRGHVNRSRAMLSEMGVIQFDEFNYIIR